MNMVSKETFFLAKNCKYSKEKICSNTSSLFIFSDFKTLSFSKCIIFGRLVITLRMYKPLENLKTLSESFPSNCVLNISIPFLPNFKLNNFSSMNLFYNYN